MRITVIEAKAISLYHRSLTEIPCDAKYSSPRLTLEREKKTQRNKLGLIQSCTALERLELSQALFN